MHKVRLEWLSENEGGRKSAPPIGRYYSVSRFLEEDIIWQNNAWSVVFELEKPIMENGKFISEGYVQFLFDTAPQERMVKYNKFEIYEGPKKVADVFLIKD